jgi:hypothetical protein
VVILLFHGTAVTLTNHILIASFSPSPIHSIPPTKYQLKPGDIQGILCHQYFHATFGCGHDIQVNPNSHQNNTNYTSFSSSYHDTTGKGAATFTGAFNFTTN